MTQAVAVSVSRQLPHINIVTYLWLPAGAEHCYLDTWGIDAMA
jgi:hypothetical protein